MQRLGAKATIIVDYNNNNSSFKNSPPFGMSGDGNENDVHIGAVFLFNKEGTLLRKHLIEQQQINGKRITAKLYYHPTGLFFFSYLRRIKSYFSKIMFQ